MPGVVIENMPHQLDARRQVAAFLELTWPLPAPHDWMARMAYWWDQNPLVTSETMLGTWAVDEGRLIGFGGFVSAQYAWQGEKIPAYYATTLRVEEAYPQVVKKLFWIQRRIMQERPIIHTTPIPRIQSALLKMGGHGETLVRRFFYPAGKWSFFKGRRWWPTLDSHRRVVTDLSEVTALVRPYQRADRLEKWVTVESLRWYCASPMREHRFIGVVDSAGCLSSFLIVTPRLIRGLRSWDVLESFSTEEDLTELHALIGTLIREPDRLPGGASLVTTAIFPNDTRWKDSPTLVTRNQSVCHFYLMPEHLRAVPKLTVMAEGDLGL